MRKIIFAGKRYIHIIKNDESFRNIPEGATVLDITITVTPELRKLLAQIPENIKHIIFRKDRCSGIDFQEDLPKNVESVSVLMSHKRLIRGPKGMFKCKEKTDTNTYEFFKSAESSAAAAQTPMQAPTQEQTLTPTQEAQMLMPEQLSRENDAVAAGNSLALFGIGELDGNDQRYLFVADQSPLNFLNEDWVANQFGTASP